MSPPEQGQRRPSVSRLAPLLLVVACSLLSRDLNQYLRVERAAERPSLRSSPANASAGGGDGAARRRAPFSTGDFVPNGIFHYAPPEDRDRDFGFFLPRAGARSTTARAECVRAWSNVTMHTWDRPGGGTIRQWPKSRFNEDVTIYRRYFPNATTGPPGVFLEIGGFDGLAESNTLFFERCLGWTGVLVEANPMSYRKMIEHRPRTANLLMSPTCQGNDAPARILPWGSTNAALTNDPTKKVSAVHCAPLGPALAELGVGRVDFFSLDVENHEIEVLETIDFERVNISVIMVESQNAGNRGGNSTANFRVRTFLKERGYDAHLGVVQASDVFVRRGR